MKRNIALITALCAAMLSIAPTPSSADADKNALMLSVTLDSIFNHHFQVMIPVTVGKPFKIVSDNGDVTNTISGTIGAPVEGKYPAPLYINEKWSKGGDVGGTRSYSLELDKEQSGGPVASFIYLRTVKLTKIAE